MIDSQAPMDKVRSDCCRRPISTFLIERCAVHRRIEGPMFSSIVEGADRLYMAATDPQKASDMIAGVVHVSSR